MLARQLHHHPAWTTAAWRPTWPRPRVRWPVMRAENLSVAAAFDLSYQDLTSDQQRLFRRLGLHPGPDIDAHAAAALDSTTTEAAPPRPGGPLRSAPAHASPPQAATGCMICSASTPRPSPPATTLLPAKRPPGGCWTITCTPRWPPALAYPPAEDHQCLVAARPATGLCADDRHSMAGLELAGGRARQPARGCRLCRRYRADPARHGDPGRHHRLLAAGRLPGPGLCPLQIALAAARQAG